MIPISPMMKLEPKEVKSFAPSHRECGAGSLEGETVSSGTLGFLEAVILSYLLTDEEIVSSSGQDQLVAKNKTP